MDNVAEQEKAGVPAGEEAEGEGKKEEEEQEKAHRRMLGNIQFFGYLYKFGLLTDQ